MSTTPATDDRPTMSARDLSFHEAQAGIAARQAAAAAGAPPGALRAMVHAAAAEPLVSRGKGRMLRGEVMRGDDLLVTLCFMLYARVFGDDPRQQFALAKGEHQLCAIAALGFIFCQTQDAWDLLDRAADVESSADVREGWKRDFRRMALEFGGAFNAEDIATIGAHVVALARHVAEDDPGNAPAPAAA